MRAKTIVLPGLKVIILAFILFGLYAIDFLGLNLTKEAWTAPATLLLMGVRIGLGAPHIVERNAICRPN